MVQVVAQAVETQVTPLELQIKVMVADFQNIMVTDFMVVAAEGVLVL